MDATHDSPWLQGPGCSQFTRCIPLYKRKATIKRTQAGLFLFRKRFVFYRFTLHVNLGDKSGGV